MDSYSEILDRMTSKYAQLSGSTINRESDIMIRMKTLAGEIYNMGVATDFLKRQMFPSTAIGEYLDQHALQRGLSRKQATKAFGKVTFYTSQPAVEDIVIDKGTIVGTPYPDAKRFATNEAAVIKAGSEEVTVSVTATKAGSDHNVLVGVVTVLVTPPVGVTQVRNKSIFNGGSDTETDDELRNRLLMSYQYISNGTNAIYYKNLAESVTGVYSAGVIPRVRGDGTVNVYICSKGDDATPAMINEVQSILNNSRELNVDVSVENADELYVSLTLSLSVEDGYSFEEVSQQVKQKLSNYIDSLGIGKAMLLKDLADIVYHIKGVKNFVFLNAFCSDCYPTNAQYCTTNTINIRQVS